MTNGTATRGGRVGGRGARRGRNTGRPKAKTADELDAEMVDYFDANAANGTAATTDAVATVNGAAAPATNGEEIGMDEISVSIVPGFKHVSLTFVAVSYQTPMVQARLILRNR